MDYLYKVMTPVTASQIFFQMTERSDRPAATSRHSSASECRAFRL